MPPSAPLIKGYLPICLKLPSRDGKKDETFCFVREHHGSKGAQQSGNNQKSGCTLFVANAPIVPGVATKILLKSIFGRYADISRVAVVEDPRNSSSNKAEEIFQTSSTWSTKFKHPTFFPHIHSEGKYAHVVFNSSKDLKKTMRALHDVMHKGDEDSGLELERIEIQTLTDETSRQHRESERKSRGQDSDDERDDEGESDKLTGILAVAQRYRASMNKFSKEELIEECNAVMEDYEEQEESKRRAQDLARTEPDDDGFVTVAYSTAVGSKTELEESTAPRRKGNKRSRRKKDGAGATELQDFYRFQRRENKKRSLEDLRAQFEEDLQKVKRMKEDRQYRPF